MYIVVMATLPLTTAAVLILVLYVLGILKPVGSANVNGSARSARTSSGSGETASGESEGNSATGCEDSGAKDATVGWGK